jgi:LacI family transcriptional regulator
MSFQKDRVTIYDVARRAGVSPATVSRVINNRGNVKESTREKVLTTIESSHFSPNQIARTLPMRTSRTIGLLAESLFTPYFSRFAHELDQVCAEKGYALVIGLTGSDKYQPQREIQVLKDFMKRQVDGFVVLGGQSNFRNIDPSFTGQMEEIGEQVPLVFVNCGFSFTECSHVHTDEAEAFGKIMDHLLALGHRTIGLIAGNRGKWTNHMKISVYREKIQAAGLKEREELIRTGVYTVESGRESSIALLTENQDMTALACANDILGVGALQGALSLGLSVPGDLSLTGFDDIDPARYVVPGITTVAQDYTGLAKAALQVILNRVKGTGDGTEITLPGKLIVRGTTGPVIP